jgi:hypothetical protein
MTYWDKKLTKLVQDNQIRHLDGDLIISGGLCPHAYRRECVMSWVKANMNYAALQQHLDLRPLKYCGREENFLFLLYNLYFPHEIELIARPRLKLLV